MSLEGIATSASPVDRITYARDLWPRHHIDVRRGMIAEHRPALVAWPSSTEEVARIVAHAAKEGIPIAPFGAGSGVCGGILPSDRTIVMDLKRLDRWSIDREDGPSIEAGAGALGILLEEDLNARGFTIGHFPSSILCSTVGGWIAARGAGQCSGLYGKIEDMVASMECVLGSGEIVRMNRRVHGPDATPLFIGSEGIFGIVTSAKLRLHPVPVSRAFGAFSFPSIEAGWTAMRAMFQAGLRPAVSRLYDPFDSFIAKMGSVRRKRAHESDEPKTEKKKKKSGGPGFGAVALRSVLRVPRAFNEVIDALGHRVLKGSTLVLIFEGKVDEARDDMERASEIARRFEAKPLGEEPARHWLEHRYSVSYRQAPVFMAGAFSDTMEVAAPWSRLGALYDGVRAALSPHVFVMAHLSHAYPDGCSIYFTMAGSAPTEDAALAKYDAAWRAALDAAISAGGTLSHHHGVGRSKAPKLGAELGLGVDIVHALRNAFDPAGIMNPGNLMPRSSPSRAPVSAVPESPIVDRDSLLVHVAGSATLESVERVLAREGLSLGIGDRAGSESVAAWIAGGAHGARDPWIDPVDHLVAGFTATMKSGKDLEVRPAPRRAVGPDLFALFLGQRERAGSIRSAWLRAHANDTARPLETSLDRDPPMGRGEEALLARLVETLA